MKESSCSLAIVADVRFGQFEKLWQIPSHGCGGLGVTSKDPKQSGAELKRGLIGRLDFESDTWARIDRPLLLVP